METRTENKRLKELSKKHSHGNPFNPFKEKVQYDCLDRITATGLEARTILIWLRLARYMAGKKGIANPLVSTLAKDVGISVRKTQTHLNKLAKLGFIQIINRKGGRGNKPQFFLLWHPCFTGEWKAPKDKKRVNYHSPFRDKKRVTQMVRKGEPYGHKRVTQTVRKGEHQFQQDVEKTKLTDRSKEAVKDLEKKRIKMRSKTSSVSSKGVSPLDPHEKSFVESKDIKDKDEVSKKLRKFKESLNKDVPADPERPLGCPELCPLCGKPIILKDGKYGKFWGCSGYRNGCRWKPKSPHIAAMDTEPWVEEWAKGIPR